MSQILLFCAVIPSWMISYLQSSLLGFPILLSSLLGCFPILGDFLFWISDFLFWMISSSRWFLILNHPFLDDFLFSICIAHLNHWYGKHECSALYFVGEAVDMSNIWMRHGIPVYKWSHIWMGHVSHMNESCCTYEWVMSHIWMSHVTHMNASCHTHGWHMSHIWMHHITHMNESYHTYEWVMSHIWMRHVAHMNESCRTYE